MNVLGTSSRAEARLLLVDEAMVFLNALEVYCSLHYRDKSKHCNTASVTALKMGLLIWGFNVYPLIPLIVNWGLKIHPKYAVFVIKGRMQSQTAVTTTAECALLIWEPVSDRL